MAPAPESVVVAPVPVAAPAAQPAPVVASQPIDASSLQVVVEQAGLQWVQTSAPAAYEPEPIAPVVRTPRVRKPRPSVSTEPLVQVETDANRNAS